MVMKKHIKYLNGLPYIQKCETLRKWKKKTTFNVYKNSSNISLQYNLSKRILLLV